MHREAKLPKLRETHLNVLFARRGRKVLCLHFPGSESSSFPLWAGAEQK